MRWLNLLFVVFSNGVPLCGVKLLGWSASTVLVLYWLENLLIAVFTCIRIAVHRRLTRKRGHWRPGQLGLLVNGKPSQAGLLGEYATMSFIFALAHGLFVGMIVFLVGDRYPDQPTWQFSAAQFRQGAGWIAGVLALELVLNLARIRSLSYAALKGQVQARIGRLFVLHLTIIGGMFAMLAMDSPSAILYLLMAFKTLWELASLRRRQAGAAPSKASTTALGADPDGSAETARRIAAEDEQVMPA